MSAAAAMDVATSERHLLRVSRDGRRADEADMRDPFSYATLRDCDGDQVAHQIDLKN